MRLIDADELIKKLHETAFHDSDDRAIVLSVIEQVAAKNPEYEKEREELRAHIEYLRRQNESMKGEIKALVFAVRCNGVSGSEVKYEDE
jgi:hypothetical protein